MGIAARLLRLCRADLNGLLDRMEDRGLLLRQYLREMEAALADTRAQLERRSARKGQIARELAVQRHRVRTMEDDIVLALARKREDIARQLVRAILSRRHRAEALNARLKELSDEILAGEDAYARQAAAYVKIRRRSMDFRAARKQTDAGAAADRGMPPGPDNRPGDAAVELELIRHKEAFEAGRTP